MSWVFNNQQPIYLQIVEKIKLEIIHGAYLPGGQLPTVRQLADTIQVNPNTVQKAMAQLELEHLVYPKGNLGRFIIDDPELPAKLLEQLTTEQTKEFLQSMKKLNISSNEIIQLISKIEKEDTQ